MRLRPSSSLTAYLWGLTAANLFLTAVPAEATTYYYNDPAVTDSGSYEQYDPINPGNNFVHSYSQLGTVISASVAFNFDTSTTSGTFFIGGTDISSATLGWQNSSVPAQGNITLADGVVTDWDIYGSGSFALPGTVTANNLTVSTTGDSDSFSFDEQYSEDDGAGGIITITSMASGYGVYGSQLLWTTPVPRALPLFATGLGMLCLFGWCRKRHAFRDATIE